MRDKFVQSGNWHVRLPGGEVVNLNSAQAANRFLEMHRELNERKRRRRRRQKPAPSENKALAGVPEDKHADADAG